MLQTILLSAHALALGTCPIGMLIPPLIKQDNPDILRIFNFLEDVKLWGLLL